MDAHWLTADTRAVFFDAVGTLLTPEPAVGAVYRQVGRRHGHDLSRATIVGRFREAFRQEEQLDAQVGWAVTEERERQRWANIVASVFRQDVLVEDCFRELWDHFARPDAWRVASRAGEVIAELMARGYAVGVASNFDRRLHAVLDGLPELAALSRRVISSEAGWRKPDARFFAAVVRAAGCAPGEIVFVGDSFDNDFVGANAVGLRGVLLDPGAQVRPGIDRIRELTELFKRD